MRHSFLSSLFPLKLVKTQTMPRFRASASSCLLPFVLVLMSWKMDLHCAPFILLSLLVSSPPLRAAIPLKALWEEYSAPVLSVMCLNICVLLLHTTDWPKAAEAAQLLIVQVTEVVPPLQVSLTLSASLFAHSLLLCCGLLSVLYSVIIKHYITAYGAMTK